MGMSAYTPMPDPAVEASPIQTEIAAVHDVYASLLACMDPELGLGGQLLFAGELPPPGARLIRAANITGAASLAASADAGALQQSMREGVIDFVVTNLDEALRILKNEIRKRQPVAVGVALSADTVRGEMLERGVQPDLLPAATSHANLAELAAFVARGARHIPERSSPAAQTFLTVPIPATWAQRTAEFEALLLGFIPPHDHANRRWLLTSPRYLGQQARRLRSFECDSETASKVRDSLRMSD